MQRILNTWKSNPLYIRVIRLWLGVTWVYGGWNKATDSGFLNQSSPHYIGEQLNGYLKTSPISSILRHMMEHSYQIGWMVMLSEFAIGIAVLLGIAIELAAFGGFAMAITLWLSATWNVKPYFLGSDTAYAILWLSLFLYLMNKKKITAAIPNIRNRREVLQLGSVAGLSLIAAFAGKIFQTGGSTPEAGKAIATLAEVPVGGNKTFTAADGSPAILFRTKAGVFAYSRICTHQGCSVNYDAQSNTLLCPCHGAQYDQDKNGAVLNGPATTPIASIKVAIKGQNIVQI
jgi:thiosulfate dehydrogenase [quinone] large subunit